MNRGLQRFIPIIFLIVIVGLIIAAAVSVVRIFTTDNNSTETSQVADTSGEALLNTTADRSVRMTVRGQIVGDEAFRSYQVVVTPGKREFTRYKGYLEQPLVSKTYENNTKAYDEFVHALGRANLAKGTALAGDADDTRGICAGGILYEFEIMNGSSVVKRLWTTTCGDAKGSLVANAGQVQQLFLAQIPDADDYIGKD
ncbi:MAG: exported protein of unknown function [Candidatus Saccharibacteria bacterium]|nr:exported protein of unknown function [Candidatus Saccharibacteria bacterium]